MKVDIQILNDKILGLSNVIFRDNPNTEWWKDRLENWREILPIIKMSSENKGVVNTILTLKDALNDSATIAECREFVEFSRRFDHRALWD